MGEYFHVKDKSQVAMPMYHSCPSSYSNLHSSSSVGGTIASRDLCCDKDLFTLGSVKTHTSRSLEQSDCLGSQALPRWLRFLHVLLATRLACTASPEQVGL
ncbi:hypothetical protein Y1Q_0009414 [Alligator mississippiensis]|uniref:Uncharacterized protein n=1 Tax=Alligator mississippiensis TaxID=8496 RepID=A0A151N8J3_ALLMI|nr:hypothetical protein Y1Q_0009414 [Alligator mississippiensis]